MSSTDSAEEVVGENALGSSGKRPKRGHFNVDMKEVVLEVYETEILENPELFLGVIAERVANKTGICSRSVRNIIKEYKTTGTFSAPKPVQNRKNTFDSLSVFEKNLIRRKVQEFFFRNEIPTIAKILQAVNDDPDLPNFKRTTFLKILKKLKFETQCHKQNKFRDIRLRWKDKIRLNNVIWRCWHLQFIKKENTLFCQFASPLDVDTYNKPKAVILEGKYWKRNLHDVTAEYKEWRMFYKHHSLLRQFSKENQDMLMNDIDLRKSESNESLHTLVNEHYMMSDTLFSSIANQPFHFPDSREIAKAGLADFIQPSLGPLQPWMDTFEQELMLSNLPTVSEKKNYSIKKSSVTMLYSDQDVMDSSTETQDGSTSQVQPFHSIKIENQQAQPMMTIESPFNDIFIPPGSYSERQNQLPTGPESLNLYRQYKNGSHNSGTIRIKEESELTDIPDTTLFTASPVNLSSIPSPTTDPLMLNSSNSNSPILDQAPQYLYSPTSSRESVSSPNHNICSKSQRRASRIHAEQTRRYNIKNGFDILHSLIPHLNQNLNAKPSKATLLQKGAEYIRQLRQEREQLKVEINNLRQQLENLNTSISTCQSMLRTNIAPISTRRDFKLFDEYIKNKTIGNWKYWIFSLIFRPLFVSFNNIVSTSSMEELYRSAILWVEQHCTLADLRSIALNFLRYLCTKTEIMSEPERLPDEARQICMSKKHSS